MRSSTSLIQTSGRAARHLDGYVIMYGDSVTPSMQNAIDETQRRRTIQLEYNRANNITPVSIQKSIQESLMGLENFSMAPLVQEEEEDYVTEGNIVALAARLEKQMHAAAKALEFERAAQLRDRIKGLRERIWELSRGTGVTSPFPHACSHELANDLVMFRRKPGKFQSRDKGLTFTIGVLADVAYLGFHTGQLSKSKVHVETNIISPGQLLGMCDQGSGKDSSHGWFR